MDSFSAISVKAGKWMSVPLLVAIIIGGYLAYNCPPTAFFGLTFGRHCNAPGGSSTQWVNSDDFQAELSKMMERTNGSLFAVGTTFHQSVQDTRLLRPIRRGADVRYVFLNPRLKHPALKRAAASFDQDPQDLQSEISNTYHGLRRVYCQLEEEKKEGHLKVRTIDEPSGVRMYFFTLEDDASGNSDFVAYVAPYVYGSDSPNLPGFKVSGRIAKSYLDAAEKLWRQATPWELSSKSNSCTGPLGKL